MAIIVVGECRDCGYLQVCYDGVCKEYRDNPKPQATVVAGAPVSSGGTLSVDAMSDATVQAVLEDLLELLFEDDSHVIAETPEERREQLRKIVSTVDGITIIGGQDAKNISRWAN